MAAFLLLDDLERMVKLELNRMGYAPQPAGLGLDAVLRRYLNVMARLPLEVPWTLKESRELTAKTLEPEIRTGLEQFKRRAASGESLRPNMSTRIGNADYSDGMFFDWHIYHFHLGVGILDDGFVPRTGDVLFATADPTRREMFLLDIRPHVFTDQDLVRVIEENWPAILEPHVLQGIEGSHLTNEEIHCLRTKNANTVLQTPGGRALAPMGGGRAASGASLRNQMEADYITMVLESVQKQLEDQREKIDGYFRERHGLGWSDLEFRLTSFGPVLTVNEGRTGMQVWTAPWGT